MEIKLIIFDLGGVLTQDNPDKKNPYITISEKYGLARDDFEKIIYTYFEDYHFKRTLSQYNFWRKTLEVIKKDVTDEEITEVIEEFNNNMIGGFNDQMIQLLHNLSSNYKLVLLSNSSREMEKAIFSSKCVRFFDRICLTHINSYKKSNPKAYAPILEDFKLDPKEVLLIDDKQKNLNGATSVGINTILFKNYSDLIEELKKMNISP